MRIPTTGTTINGLPHGAMKNDRPFNTVVHMPGFTGLLGGYFGENLPGLDAKKP